MSGEMNLNDAETEAPTPAIAEAPTETTPRPRPSMRFPGYVFTALVSATAGIVITVVVTNYFQSKKPELDLRDEIPRMQSVIDFESVATWAMECMGAASYESLPLWHQELLSYYRPENVKAEKLPNGVRNLHNQERAILLLNRSLSFEREYYKTEVRDTYFYFKYLTLISIAVGMLTTIFVSISSTEFGRGEGKWQKYIRLVAIILPVIGTAISGVIGFYSPQAKWNQASHTLASLTQLHGQMAIGIWDLKCIENPDDVTAKAAKSMLDEWSKRHVDIQTVSAAAGGPGGTTSTGGAGAKQ
jgi:hypothetical protein